MSDDEEIPIYAGSDRSLYTGWTMWNEGKRGHWKPVMWDNDAGWSLKWDTRAGELAWFVRMTISELPEWAVIRRGLSGGYATVIDTQEEDR
jgi:hypothetical protein